MTQDPTDPPQGAEPPNGARLAPTIEFLLKFAAVPGAILYAVLFIAYRRYYSALGISPEDAGVGNTYILSRSLGLASLIMLFVALAAVAVYLEDLHVNKRYPAEQASGVRGRIRLLDRLHSIAARSAGVLKSILAMLFGGFVTSLYPKSTPFWLIAPSLLLIALVTAAEYGRFGEHKHLVRFIVAPTVGVLVLTAALNTYSNHQASARALLGCHVRPLEFFGIVILDISATSAQIEWAGSNEQLPRNFTGSSSGTSVEGLVVGRGSVLSFLRPDKDRVTLIQVPATLVVTRFDPRATTDLETATASACQ